MAGFFTAWARRRFFRFGRRIAGKAIPYRVPGYPVTPLLFVLAALAIVGNAVYGALADPHQFTYLLVAIAIMLLGLPGVFFLDAPLSGPLEQR